MRYESRERTKLGLGTIKSPAKSVKVLRRILNAKQIKMHRRSAPGLLQLLFGKSNQLSGELIGRRVHLRSKTHRILQKAICDRFPQVIEVLPNDAKT